MTDEEFLKVGGNISLIHVDFMFGTKDLDITGINHNGQSIQFLEMETGPLNKDKRF